MGFITEKTRGEGEGFQALCDPGAHNVITCHEDSSSISPLLQALLPVCWLYLQLALLSGAKMAKEFLDCESSLLTVF